MVTNGLVPIVSISNGTWDADDADDDDVTADDDDESIDDDDMVIDGNIDDNRNCSTNNFDIYIDDDIMDRN
ncbi:hypothetical protein DERF_013369 [Dermatophagoides farinae]|uniref:Uncharacterized protein n=1 Tax=Dermatophagoides farinae TaxID=6954 RepID=A0A922HR17_DERFA|nr:hypothetical protein DERF_013369 [Dermatophagoides farinae]